MRASRIFIVTVTALAFFAGCSKPESASNMPAPSASPAATPPTPAAPVTPTVAATPDVIISAQEFSKAFQEGDQEATKAKYVGKTLQLTGVVKNFSSLRRGVYFDIVGEGIGTLHFYPQDMKGWQKVASGNTVTARGLYMSDGVFGIDHCVLVSATGTPAPSMTSKELAEKFYPSPSTFNRQFELTDPKVIVNNLLRIDGKVVAKQTGKYDNKQLVLEGTDDQHQITIGLPDNGPGTPDPRDAIKVGQHVTVFGA